MELLMFPLRPCTFASLRYNSSGFQLPPVDLVLLIRCGFPTAPPDPAETTEGLLLPIRLARQI